MDRKFLASLLRCNNSSRLIDAAVERATTETRERVMIDYNKRMESEIERRMRDVKSDADRYKALCKRLGDSYWLDDEELMAAVQFVRSSGVAKSYDGVRALHVQLIKAAERIGKELATLGVKIGASDE
jgi:SOS response regulatory protein OraA/RecX